MKMLLLVLLLFTQRPSTGLSVSGKVIGQSSLGAIEVRLSGTGSVGYINLSAPEKPDGSFEFADVPPGTYTISLRPAPFSEPKTVRVTDRDLTGLELIVPWTGNLTGRVSVEGGGPAPVLPVVFAGDGRRSTGYHGDGSTFSVILPEGFFQFTTQVPPGFYLKSVTAGSTDLLANPIRMSRTEPAPEIVVVLGVSAPSPWLRLSGRLKSSGQSPITISVSGPEGGLPGLESHLSTNVSKDGAFEFPKILPGSYTVTILPVALYGQSMKLVVPNRDVAGLEIALPVVKEITGRIIVEGGGAIPYTNLMISPSVDSQHPANPSTSLPNPDGLLFTASQATGPARISMQNDGTFKGYFPEGRYFVTPEFSTSAAYSVKSFTYGSTDLLMEPLAVGPGDSSEMRLTLSPASTNSWVKVSGRVVGLPATLKAEEFPSVSLHPTALRDSAWAKVQPDGTFEFSKVYSDKYQLLLNGIVSVGSGAALALSEVLPRRDINVGTSDVTGLILVLPTYKEISGRVVLEGRGALPRLVIPLTAVASANGTPEGRAPVLNIDPQADGTFKVLVPEGEWQVGRRNNIPTAYTVKSILYDSVDLSSAPLKVTARDTAELRVTLTAPEFRPVKVSGRVIGLDAGRIPIRVFLTDGGRLASAINLQASVLPDGSFEFPEVFPGSYSVRLAGTGALTKIPAIPIVVSTTDIRNVEFVIPAQ
jgi:hypothetical protein